jgi:urease accessory protein
MTTVTDATTICVDDAGVRGDGGALRVQRLEPGPDAVRVALVPTSALLLAGDHVAVDIEVAAGCGLEIVEPGGTVAYAMRGDEAAWDVRVRLGDRSRLVWHGEPFVVSADAAVRRSLTVALAATASAVVRETVVLGRSGEAPGLLDSLTTISREGVPVLVERLLAGDGRPGLGRHRVLDQVLHLGVGAARCPATPGATMRLESGDVLHRWIGQDTHASPIQVCPAIP